MIVLDSFDNLLVSQALVKKNLVCLPTDTLYALCADACSSEAVEKVFLAKKRKSHKALPIFVGSVEQAFSIGKFNDKAIKLANNFWPGSLTIIVPLQKHASIPPLVTAGQKSIAIRIPANDELVDFLKIYGNPITATSANLSETEGGVNEAEVVKNLGEYIEIFVRSSKPLGVFPSTIVSCVDEHKVGILREGAINSEEINRILTLTTK